MEFFEHIVMAQISSEDDFMLLQPDHIEDLERLAPSANPNIDDPYVLGIIEGWELVIGLIKQLPLGQSINPHHTVTIRRQAIDIIWPPVEAAEQAGVTEAIKGLFREDRETPTGFTIALLKREEVEQFAVLIEEFLPERE